MKKTPLNNGEKAEKEVLRDEKGRIQAGSAPLNPAGKPKGSKHLTTLLFNALLERAKNEDVTLSKNTYSDLLIKRILNDAIIKGNSSMIHLIVNYIDGMPEQGIDVTSGGEVVSATSIDVLAIAQRVSNELKERKTK